MIRWISVSRPITGSSSFFSAAAVRSRLYFSSSLLPLSPFPFRPFADAGFVRIVAFDDPELPGFNARRTPEDLTRMKRAAEGWDGVLFSFQHTPLLPPGQCCFNDENAPEILSLLRESGYRGTLSGHFHPGKPLAEADGLQFFVQPALCEPPFLGTLLRIGRNGIVAAEPFEAARYCRLPELD